MYHHLQFPDDSHGGALSLAKVRFEDRRLAGLDIGSRERVRAQRQLIAAKPLIKRAYDLWYKRLLQDADSVAAPAGARVLELGSGASYLKDLRPDIITSDVISGVADMVVDGRRLPFADASLKAIVMSHVFHHLPDVEAFLREADRTLVPGGVVAMIDETHTPWARFFFGVLHPEPYDDRAAEWAFDAKDAAAANQALSWMVFVRDQERFQRLFPRLRLERREYLPWLSYLLAGGVNLPDFVPRPLAGAVARLDTWLRPLDRFCAIHWHLTLRKKAESEGGL